MAFDTGLRYVNIAGGPISFYVNYTTTNLYVEQVFGANVITTLVLANDSATDTVDLSFDGATLEAELLPKESLTLNTSTKSSIYLKGVAGGGTVRVWGW